MIPHVFLPRKPEILTTVDYVANTNKPGSSPNYFDYGAMYIDPARNRL